MTDLSSHKLRHPSAVKREEAGAIQSERGSMTMFDATDRTRTVEFPFTPSVVFRAVAEAITVLPGMTFHEFDQLSGHVYVTTAASAFLGGERVGVSVLDAGSGRSRVQIASGAKTVFGSASTRGRSRKNVEEIISATSNVLGTHGEKWTQQLVLESGDRAKPADVEARLSRLEDIYANSLITEAEYRQRREAILRYLGGPGIAGVRPSPGADDGIRTRDPERTWMLTSSAADGTRSGTALAFPRGNRQGPPGVGGES